MPNQLYFGDNLDLLRNPNYFPNECVDLIYLDPPFNSSRDYNLLFKESSGLKTESQIVAFKDTWEWTAVTEQTYLQVITHAPEKIIRTIEALRQILGRTSLMAYLVMMAARLSELHRVLRSKGSLYLHCDPTAGHYLKIVLDAIFGPENFRNQITWRRTNRHNDARRKLANVSDLILFYSKSDQYYFNQGYTPYDADYLEKHYRHIDADGRRYTLADLRSPNPRPNLTYDYKGYKPHEKGWAISLERMQQLDAEGRLYFPANPNGRIRLKNYLDDMEGIVLTDIWDDIKPIQAHSKERLGYPTQKPVKLLERIVQMSSNPGDVILDPFCGCGTAISAAQNLGRQWIGIDIAALSVSVIKVRLFDEYDLTEKVDYEILGEPTTLADARRLAEQDRYQFQWWACSLVRARPMGEAIIGSGKGKKGKDRGVDGVINFVDEVGGQPSRQAVIVQVKSGKVKSGDIRDLVGVLDREQAPIGVFITLEEPSRDMLVEAMEAGHYHSTLYGQPYPRLQILTVMDLVEGKVKVEMPPQHGTFTQAERQKMNDSNQPNLF